MEREQQDECQGTPVATLAMLELSHTMLQARRALALAVNPKAAGRKELERAREAELDWGVDLRHSTASRQARLHVPSGRVCL